MRDLSIVVIMPGLLPEEDGGNDCRMFISLGRTGIAAQGNLEYLIRNASLPAVSDSWWQSGEDVVCDSLPVDRVPARLCVARTSCCGENAR